LRDRRGRDEGRAYWGKVGKCKVIRNYHINYDIKPARKIVFTGSKLQ
jgi:hypothetical protein